MRPHLRLIVLAATIVLGCSDATKKSDPGGSDAGTRGEDAGAKVDASSTDGGADPDGDLQDAGPFVDLGPITDATTTTDVGGSDVGTLDLGIEPDAATQDAGTADVGTAIDQGEPDMDECADPSLTLCYGTCVDLTSDSQYCGSCAARCGVGKVCVDSTCVLRDSCAVFGCSEPGERCSPVTDRCEPFCADDSECATGETCYDGTCGQTCASDQLRCNGYCSYCGGIANATSFACEQFGCAAASCEAGYELCKGPRGTAFKSECCPVSDPATGILFDEDIVHGTTIALNGDTPHIVWAWEDQNYTPRRMLHTHWNGFYWVGPNVLEESATDRYDYPALSIDANGVAHLVYAVWGTNELKYANLPPGGTWTTEVVVSERVANLDLVVDSQNRPQIVYQAGPPAGPFDIWYTTRDANGWAAPTKLSSTAGGFVPALAIGPNDDLHVLFRNGTADDLAYRTRSNGTWGPIEAVAVRASLGSRSEDIAVDSSGMPAVAYTDANTDEIRYTTRGPSGWNASELVWDEVDCCTYYRYDMLTLLFDAQDTPHVTYLDHGGYRTYFAELSLSSRGAAGWNPPVSVQKVGGRVIGDDQDAVFDSSGTIHISTTYSTYMLLNDVLFYATATP